MEREAPSRTIRDRIFGGMTSSPSKSSVARRERSGGTGYLRTDYGRVQTVSDSAPTVTFIKPQTWSQTGVTSVGMLYLCVTSLYKRKQDRVYITLSVTKISVLTPLEKSQGLQDI